MAGSQHEIEYFRVIASEDDQSSAIIAEQLALQHFFHELDDTPQNRTNEVNDALDHGYTVRAERKYVPIDGDEPYGETETYTLGEDVTGVADDDDRVRHRGIRNVLLITGTTLAPKGGRIAVVNPDKEVLMPNGDRAAAKTVLKPGRVIGLHMEELDVTEAVTRDGIKETVTIKADVPIIRLIMQDLSPIVIKGSLPA